MLNVSRLNRYNTASNMISHKTLSIGNILLLVTDTPSPTDILVYCTYVFISSVKLLLMRFMTGL